MVVNVLVTFPFELWLGYYVDLVKTSYYNSFFMYQILRMVTIIFSWKIFEWLGDISQPFAIWSPSVLRTSRGPQYFCSTFSNWENSNPYLPKKCCMRSMLMFTSRSVFKDSINIYFMVGSHGIISV